MKHLASFGTVPSALARLLATLPLVAAVAYVVARLSEMVQ